MKTPLELALEQARHGSVDLHGPARLTPLQALGLWLRLYGATFFGLFCCALAASISTPLLLYRRWPETEPATVLFATLGLCLVYCLGNILLLQGLRGAGWVHGTLFAVLLPTGLLAWPQAHAVGLGCMAAGAALGGLLLVLSARYRSLLALHRQIRTLRSRLRR